jgi:hypothetical protein
MLGASVLLGHPGCTIRPMRLLGSADAVEAYH